MSRLRLVVALLGGALVIAIGVLTVKTLQATGQLTTINPMGGEGCSRLSGVVGAEDAVVDHGSGIAYVSATDRAAAMNGAPARGEILAVDLTASGSYAFIPLTAGTPADFAPHGLSLWRSPEGEERLFVVNHRRQGGDSIEIFRVGPAGLVHLRSVADPLFTEANDVHAVGPDRFYVTNNATGSPFTRFVDFILQRPRAKVIFHDGKAGRAVADGLVFANGINASPDGRTLYVADTFARNLRFFEPDPATGDLAATGTLQLGTGLDNIDVDADGGLWLAAHPRLIDMVRYATGWREQAPSQVIRGIPGPNGGGEMRTALLDLGERLSASSVAARYGTHYLVGSFRDAGMLLCPVPPSGG